MSLVADLPPHTIDASLVTRVDRARTALTGGGTVVLDGGDQGSFLVTPAAKAEPPSVARLVRLGSGHLVVAAPGELLDALRLPPAVGHRAGPHRQFTVSFDATDGIGTGISARDRARALSVIADVASTPSDLTRPGHVVATRTAPLGVLGRAAVAEAAGDLAALAGRPPVAAMCALLDDTRGDLLTSADVSDLAAREGLPLVSVDEVLAHRLRHDPPLRRDEDLQLSTSSGPFTATRFRDLRDDQEHLALRTAGARVPRGGAGDALVAVLLDCRLGALGSLTCGCASDRDTALSLVASSAGLVLQLAGGANGSAPGGPGGLVAAMLGSLTGPQELSHPVTDSGPGRFEGRPRVRLLRPATSCHASADALARLAPALRELGVDVHAESLLSHGTAAPRPSALAGGNAA